MKLIILAHLLFVQSLFTIKAIVILDNSGSAILSRYYPIDNELDTREKQAAFEKILFEKTNRQNCMKW